MTLPEMIPGTAAWIIVALVATDALINLAGYIEVQLRREREEDQRGRSNRTDH